MLLDIRKLYQHFSLIKLQAHSKRQLRKAKTGKNTFVFGNIDVVDSQNLTIGDGCSFNHGCYINASNGITIGNDVTISANAVITSTGIDYYSWVNGKKSHIVDGKISLGDHIWIGANATLLPGTVIDGEYVVVAANSVVTKDIHDSYCVYAGTPAKKIKSISKIMEE